MGALVREMIEQERKDAFFKNLVFSTDMIPELLLLGTVEHKTVPMDDGRQFSIDIIHYEGKQYVMKQTEIKRWFDER